MAALAVVSCRRADPFRVDPTGEAPTRAAPPASAAAPPTSASAALPAELPPDRATDELPTAIGPLRVVPIHGASVLFRFRAMAFYVDPVSDRALEHLPSANYILLTSAEPGHLDLAAVQRLRRADTVVLGPAKVAAAIPGTITLPPGQLRNVDVISVEPLPWTNAKREPGVGYVLGFGDVRIYVSGDAPCPRENDRDRWKDLTAAFIAFGRSGTMTTDAAATCVAALRPSIVFPYHHDDADLTPLREALARFDAGAIDVRERAWY